MDIRPKPPDQNRKKWFGNWDWRWINSFGIRQRRRLLKPKRRSIRISKHKKSAGELPHRWWFACTCLLIRIQFLSQRRKECKERKVNTKRKIISSPPSLPFPALRNGGLGVYLVCPNAESPTFGRETRLRRIFIAKNAKNAKWIQREKSVIDLVSGN